MYSVREASSEVGETFYEFLWEISPVILLPLLAPLRVDRRSCIKSDDACKSRLAGSDSKNLHTKFHCFSSYPLINHRVWLVFAPEY